MEGFQQDEEITVHTPFGHPSDTIVSGLLDERRIFFLPRHGKGHTILPHEINHRANIWALKSLGVAYIICVAAVGSLKEEYAPRDIVMIDQFYDRTSRRAEHTFFGNGIAAHVQFAEPISENLRQIVSDAAHQLGVKAHDGGTYVNMDGPAFSTKAESHANRQLGFDVIGMTNVAEAKLAREAEIALCTMAMVTDYDCWKSDEESVSLQTVLGHLSANSTNAQDVIKAAIKNIPNDADADANWPEHSALANSIVTQPSYWPDDTKAALLPIIEKYS